MDRQKVNIEKIDESAPFILRNYTKHPAVSWNFSGYSEPMCHSVTTEFQGKLAPTIYPKKATTASAAVMRGWVDETQTIKESIKPKVIRRRKKAIRK